MSGGRLSPEFEPKNGLHQGGNLSPKMFKVYVYDIPGKPMSMDDIPWLVEMAVPCLFFADDLVLFAKTNEALQKLVDKTVLLFKEKLLLVNIQKTRLVVVFNKARRNKENR